MKRVLLHLYFILFMSLSACTVIIPKPVVDSVQITPASTQTTQVQVVELATATAQPTAAETALLPAATEQATPTQAQMPPLITGGWQRVGENLTFGEALPFTFELPNGWFSPNGGPYWIPAGQPAESLHTGFGINQFFDDLYDAPDSDLLIANSAVQSRTSIVVNGVEYWKYQVVVFNGEGGSASAYETDIIIRMKANKRAYVMQVTSSTEEGRAALEDILTHAIESLTYNQ
jgi:hypothetical protein